MAREKSGRAGKVVNLTLSDADIITKRVYGRRTLLRGFGAALLGAGAIAAPTGGARSADTDKRELGDKGADRFADSTFRDPKGVRKPLLFRAPSRGWMPESGRLNHFAANRPS